MASKCKVQNLITIPCLQRDCCWLLVCWLLVCFMYVTGGHMCLKQYICQAGDKTALLCMFNTAVTLVPGPMCLRLLHMTTVFALYCSHQHWHHETVLCLHLANLQHENLPVRLSGDLSKVFEPPMQCCGQGHYIASSLHVAPGSSILFIYPSL